MSKIMNRKTRKLLLAVKRQILKEPRQFDMSIWFNTAAGIPNCHTAACIAGWVACKYKNVTPSVAVEKFKPWIVASRALRIGSIKQESLFFLSHWPKKFLNNYYKSDKFGKARIAAYRIDHFLKTGE